MKTTVALAGGVGAAKFLRGLVRVIPPKELLIVGNTGDDLDLYGLHVSPDLDTIMYTLAGKVDESKGWGVREDTHNALDMLGDLGFETWFKLGDKDLATHIVRTKLLTERETLSQATAHLCKMFGVQAELAPMTDHTVRTKIVTGNQTLDFQEYFVRNRAKDTVTSVIYEGAAEVEPSPGVAEALTDAEDIIICPSNPILSIAPILTIPKIRKAVRKTKAQITAISPIVAGKALRGPADKIMAAIGYEPSAFGVAKYYEDLIHELVIDQADAAERNRIEKLGIRVNVTNTIMRSLEDSIHLAKVVMTFK